MSDLYVCWFCTHSKKLTMTPPPFAYTSGSTPIPRSRRIYKTVMDSEPQCLLSVVTRKRSVRTFGHTVNRGSAQWGLVRVQQGLPPK